MKKPLTASDWATLWQLRRAGFALDLLPHSDSRLKIDIYPQRSQPLIAAGGTLTWVQLPVALRSSALLTIVEVFLLLDAPPLEYRSLPDDRLPAPVRAMVARRRSRAFRFTSGAGQDPVLHLPGRSHLRASFLLAGQHALPNLAPGESLPAELWLRDVEGRYYGAGFPWKPALAAESGSEEGGG
jgi:hypothetical protein